MERIRRDVSVVLPFVLLGLVGGWLTGTATCHGMHGPDGAISFLLTLFTPISCAFLGEHLRGRIRGRFLLRTILATLLAGVLNGVFVGVFIGAGAGVVVGMVCGLFFALPFVPATLFIVAAARRAGRAGAGSLVDAADRRGVWSATLTAIALGGLLVLAAGAPLPMVSLSTAVGLVVLVILDGEALHRLARLEQLTHRLQKRDRFAPPLVTVEAKAIDLGIGDDVFDEIVRSPQPYREPDRLVRVVVGDVAQARAALVGALRRDLVSLGVVLLAMTLELTTR